MLYQMGEKKSLLGMIGNALGFTAIAYPLYSLLSSAVSKNLTFVEYNGFYFAVYKHANFVEKLKEPSTIAVAAGMGLGYLIVNGVKEAVKSSRLEKGAKIS